MPRRWVTHASPYSAYAPRITSVSLCVRNRWPRASDRKSTRLNSSHTVISYAVFCLKPSAPTSTLFPYTTLFRSPVVERLLAQAVTGEEERAARAVPDREGEHAAEMGDARLAVLGVRAQNHLGVALCPEPVAPGLRSEEHTSELQSHSDLVCRLLLEAVSTYIHTLSLHDALPISSSRAASCPGGHGRGRACRARGPRSRRRTCRGDG